MVLIGYIKDMAHLAILDGYSIASEIKQQMLSPYDREQVFRFTPIRSPLGELVAPVWCFEYENNLLKNSNPELDDQARAATVYFSILARNPVVTSTDEAPWYDWETLLDSNKQTPEWMLGVERLAAIPAITIGRDISATELYRLGPNYLPTPANEAYFKAVAKLQKYIAKRGLWNGIQKTLNEQSRKSQAEKAALDASKAAAAYAAAMARMNADTSEEARIEAAKAEAKAEELSIKAQEAEIELEKKLDNISKGLPEDFGEVKKTSTSPFILLALGAAAVYFLFGRGGK